MKAFLLASLVACGIAVATEEMPEALGNVSGVIMNPAGGAARFALNWARLTRCKLTTIEEIRWYECEAPGASLQLTIPYQKAVRVDFDKCYVQISDKPGYRYTQYIFNGIYTEQLTPFPATAKAYVQLDVRPDDPAGVRGIFKFPEWGISYGLVGKRAVSLPLFP